MTMTNLSNSLRVIWAIATKDIVDAIKSKTTLSVFLSVFFVVGMYRVLPILLEDKDSLNVLVHDAGNSTLVAYMENSPVFEVWTGYRSETHLKEKLANGEVPELGLVIPANFDSGKEATLRGYAMYWVSETQVAELKQRAEDEISRLASRPVSIHLDGNVVYMRPESRGIGLMAALGMCFVIITIGISLVPHLILEEKRSKTMDALLISPASPVHVIIAKTIAGLFYAVMGVGLAFALNAHLIVQWWLAILAALCGSLFTVGLGLLVGSLTEARQQTASWAWGMAAPLFIPLILSIMDDLLPAWLIAIFQWFPSVALFKVLRASLSKQAPLAWFGPQLALMLAFAALVLSLVTWHARRTDQ